jgi:hypothetical protein
MAFNPTSNISVIKLLILNKQVTDTDSSETLFLLHIIVDIHYSCLAQQQDNINNVFGSTIFTALW